ncbi:MAG: DUF4105 domain-containing protein [Bacteroidota bacterium]
MRKCFLTILWLTAFTPGLLTAQGIQLSPNASVSLLTCGSGAEMYSFFGHTALRVFDPVNRVNRVYNYGTFDFAVPNFYWQFIKGKLYYMLSVSRFEGFIKEYISENRYIKELPLTISQEDKQELYELLEINYLPENRHYWYDFTRDNCTTRVRDIVVKATGGAYLWPPDAGAGLTFRQLLLPYLKAHPWERTGILLLLTAGADKQASLEEYMFLPERLHICFAGAETAAGDRLTGPERQIFTPTPLDKGPFRLFHPYVIFTIIAAVSLYLGLRKKVSQQLQRIWFSIIFLISGLLGILFTFMWFGSEHWICHANLNIAWAFPLHILLAVILWFRKTTSVTRLYSRIMLVVTALFLVTFIFWKQSIPPEGLLMALATLAGLFRFSGFKQSPQPKPEYQAN